MEARRVDEAAKLRAEQEEAAKAEAARNAAEAETARINAEEDAIRAKAEAEEEVCCFVRACEKMLEVEL